MALSGPELAELLSQADLLLRKGAIGSTEKDELVASVAAQVSHRARASQARVNARLHGHDGGYGGCDADDGVEASPVAAEPTPAPPATASASGACARTVVGKKAAAAWARSCVLVAAACAPALLSHMLPAGWAACSRRRRVELFLQVLSAPALPMSSPSNCKLSAARASRIGFALARASERNGTFGITAMSFDDL